MRWPGHGCLRKRDDTAPRAGLVQLGQGIEGSPNLKAPVRCRFSHLKNSCAPSISSMGWSAAPACGAMPFELVGRFHHVVGGGCNQVGQGAYAACPQAKAIRGRGHLRPGRQFSKKIPAALVNTALAAIDFDASIATVARACVTAITAVAGTAAQRLAGRRPKIPGNPPQMVAGTENRCAEVQHPEG